MITAASPAIDDILDKAVSGDRLSPEEGLTLLQSHDLSAIGAAANAVTQRTMAVLVLDIYLVLQHRERTSTLGIRWLPPSQLTTSVTLFNPSTLALS